MLTNTGKVYMCGDGEDQLRQHLRRPTHIHVLPKGEYMTNVACTSNRAYALTDSGRLYRWGTRDVNLDPEGSTPLEPLHFIAGVMRLACGSHHMAVICTVSHGLEAQMISRQRAGSVSIDISTVNSSKEADQTAVAPVKVLPQFSV